jgi:hypothetical protein
MARTSRAAAQREPESPEEVAARVHALLDRAGLDVDDRTRLLAGAMVIEALRPYWSRGLSAEQAHAALRREDPEMADCIEAIAPALAGRIRAHEDARSAIEAVEALLRSGER